MRRKAKTRPDAEIEKVLEDLHHGLACYLAIFGKDADWKILAGIDLTLHWVLGENNKFQKIVDSLSEVTKSHAEAIAQIAKEEPEHDASRSN